MEKELEKLKKDNRKREKQLDERYRDKVNTLYDYSLFHRFDEATAQHMIAQVMDDIDAAKKADTSFETYVNKDFKTYAKEMLKKYESKQAGFISYISILLGTIGVTMLLALLFSPYFIAQMTAAAQKLEISMQFTFMMDSMLNIVILSAAVMLIYFLFTKNSYEIYTKVHEIDMTKHWLGILLRMLIGALGMLIIVLPQIILMFMSNSLLFTIDVVLYTGISLALIIIGFVVMPSLHKAK